MFQFNHIFSSNSLYRRQCPLRRSLFPKSKHRIYHLHFSSPFSNLFLIYDLIYFYFFRFSMEYFVVTLLSLRFLRYWLKLNGVSSLSSGRLITFLHCWINDWFDFLYFCLIQLHCIFRFWSIGQRGVCYRYCTFLRFLKCF
jgi:hypothetical protein